MAELINAQEQRKNFLIEKNKEFFYHVVDMINKKTDWEERIFIDKDELNDIYHNKAPYYKIFEQYFIGEGYFVNMGSSAHFISISIR